MLISPHGRSRTSRRRHGCRSQRGELVDGECNAGDSEDPIKTQIGRIAVAAPGGHVINSLVAACGKGVRASRARRDCATSQQRGFFFFFLGLCCISVRPAIATASHYRDGDNCRPTIGHNIPSIYGSTASEFCVKTLIARTPAASSLCLRLNCGAAGRLLAVRASTEVRGSHMSTGADAGGIIALAMGSVAHACISSVDSFIR